MPEDTLDAVSMSDDRQPFHVISGKVLDQRAWREQLKDATELFDAFKRQAYKDGTI